MKKLSIIFLLVSILCLNSCGLFEDGYLYVGDGWQDTPEKALAIAADDTAEMEQALTIEYLLETRYIDDIAIMRLSEKDVVRHRLVQEIIKAYERNEELNERKG